MGQKQDLEGDISHSIDRLRELDAEVSHSFQAVMARRTGLTNEQLRYLNIALKRVIELLERQ